MTHGDEPRLSPAPPILDNKNSALPSVFSPTALLREARRQKGIAKIDVPEICLLDPDGDIVRALMRNGNANSFEGWAISYNALYRHDCGANVRVLCLAHVTNNMGQLEGDFEKGTVDGTDDALILLEALVNAVSDV